MYLFHSLCLGQTCLLQLLHLVQIYLLGFLYVLVSFCFLFSNLLCFRLQVLLLEFLHDIFKAFIVATITTTSGTFPNFLVFIFKKFFLLLNLLQILLLLRCSLLVLRQVLPQQCCYIHVLYWQMVLHE